MRNNGPDPYAILHIEPTATAREVARAYRMLMRGRHPDTRPAREDGPTEPELQELRDIMGAYAILGNPEKRAAYDREHPRPAAAAKPQRPAGSSVTPAPALPGAFVLIGPVIRELPGGRSPGMAVRQGPYPPNGYTLILRIRP